MRGIREDQLTQKHIDEMVTITDYANTFIGNFRETGKSLIEKGFNKESIDTLLDMVLLDFLDLYTDLHGGDFTKIINWMKFKYQKDLFIKLKKAS